MYTPEELGIDTDLLVTEQDGFNLITTFKDEFMDPEELFEFEEDIQAIYEGDVCWLIMEVKAYKNGIELGSDSIGGLAYSWDHIDDIVAKDSYYPDLISAAVKQAKDNINKLCGNV